MKNLDKIPKILVAMANNISNYPPAITLVSILLDLGYQVKVLAYNTQNLPDSIINNRFFSCANVPVDNNTIIDRIKRNRIVIKVFENEYSLLDSDDIIWTIDEFSIRYLRNVLLNSKVKHIMQLTELSDRIPKIANEIKYMLDLGIYARNAYKVVVSEENRAYIQKAIWNLSTLPYVFPNKSNVDDIISINDELNNALDQIKRIDKRIIFYVGAIGADRDIEPFAEAIEKINGKYHLCLVGLCFDEQRIQKMINNYSCVTYLGNFKYPNHLILLKYAYIGLLSYKPDLAGSDIRKLNTVYCAPNKIFEYSKYNVPMISTDSIVLKQQFKEYGIGVCCKDLKPETIINAINKIEENYQEYSSNCEKFYNSVDMKKIVSDILSD